MRYTGPKYKRARRLNFSLLETGEELNSKRYLSSTGEAKRKKKISEYGKQLIEKQKMAQMYGVNERQFRRLFNVALASKEVTGLALFHLLESRLDNVVFRMNFARTRRAARQLVNHGHVLVNGKKIDIPSYEVKVGDKISFRESSRDMKVIKEALESAKYQFAAVKVDPNRLEGEYVRLPERSELPQDINEAQVIEYYNRLL